MKNKKIAIIIGVIVGIILIGAIALCVVNIKKNAKQANSKIEEAVEAEINTNEEVEEYANINELEQEEIVEENTKDTVGNEKNTNTKSNVKSSNPYYIKVNYGAQVVTIYKQDENGEYTIPYKAMVCSTGVATPTSGVYSIPARWEWLGLQGDVYGHYSTQIKGNILFHSVPYLRKGDKSSLEYWEYDKLGTYASAGCIRLTVSDAKWIFYNCGRGTKVEFYSSSNPGPLGKPTAKKISSYPEYLRNWDPTDPDASNPWHSYKSENKKNEITNTEVVNNVVNTNTEVINNTVAGKDTNVVVNEVYTNAIVENTTVTNTTTNTTTTNTVSNTTNTSTNTTIVNEVIKPKEKL